MSIKDVSQEPEGSAQQAFMLIWFYGQWGSSPIIADTLYSSRVRRTLGADVIAGTYAAQRTDMLRLRPEVTATRTTPRGRLVTAYLLSVDGSPRPESYLFLRENGSWMVAYDSYMQSGLNGYVQSVEQDHIAPSASKASPGAVAAGRRAARRYLRLATGQEPPTGQP